MKKILSIDIGGTFIKYALINNDLEIIEKGKMPSNKNSLDEYIETLKKIYDIYKHQIDGVAFSMPGVIDSNTGFLYTGGSFNDIVHDINVKELFEKELNTKISVANDAKCAAYAEMQSGCLKGIKNAVVLVFGTAIGGSVIIDGKIVDGANFSAGEFSFINTCINEVSINNAFAFKCGSSGLNELAKKELQINEELDGYKIFELANSGDEKALKAVHDFAYRCAVEIYNLQAILDPEVFAIGGGISEQPLLLDEINSCFLELKTQLPIFLRIPKIISCKYNNDANIIGAASRFYLEYFNKI